MTDTARAIAMIRRLVAFDTTSALSNLALIEDVKAYLAGYGIDSRLTFDEAHGKANLYATIGPKDKGGIVLSGRRTGTPPLLGLFAIAGLFHGWAYGASIVGAEPTPLIAYLAGFSLIQYAIAAGSGYLALRVWNAADQRAVHPRLAGAVVAGIGLTFLIENLEGLLLA